MLGGHLTLDLDASSCQMRDSFCQGSVSRSGNNTSPSLPRPAAADELGAVAQ